MNGVVSPRRAAVPLACASLVASCTPFKDDSGGNPGLDRPASDGGGATDESDAAGPTAVALPACDPTKPFGAPILVAGLNAASDWLAGLRLSPDGLTGYFYTNRPAGGRFGLYTATRTAVWGPFGDVAALGDATINTPADQSNPSVTADGTMLAFSKNEIEQPSGPYHLYYATRTSASAPFVYRGPIPNVGDPNATDDDPFLRQDGQVLYFDSDRVVSGSTDLFYARWNGTAFDAPTPMVELNSSFGDSTPVVTPDDRTIYFTSDRPVDGAATAWRIWTAQRASADSPFSTPTNVAELDLGDDVWPSFATSDGCALYFARKPRDTQYTFGSVMPYVAQKPAR